MAFTDRDDLNFLGRLYLIGANQTPFLNMIGGLQGGTAQTWDGHTFPVAQPWALTSASQDTQSEATSAVAGTATTYTRTQDTNFMQIMKLDYASTFAKQSSPGIISGVAQAGQVQPVQDELAFQRAAAMKQLAINIEWSFLQGVGVDPATSATNGKTDGMLTAIATNTVTAAGGDVTKAMIQELLIEMANNGAQWGNMIMFANAFNKTKITDIYDFVPESRNVGGSNIQQIETDFTMMGVQYAPQMPTDEIYIIDMSVVKPMFNPSRGQVIRDQPVAITSAKEGGFIYTELGLDYGPEEYHGSITGTSTS